MSARQPTLLTIDDESLIRETIAMYMETRGFVVFEAPDGRRGLDVFREKRPDLVLVDLRMLTLQKLLTHKSPQMTKRYSHLRDEALKQASEVAGDLLGSVGNGQGAKVVNIKGGK